MRKSGVKGLGRLLSVLMVAALLMTTAMVPALALDRWEDVVVSVIWTDSQGQQQTTQAFPVPDSAEHAYWATLDASALFSTVQVQVVSSDPAYTFYLKDYASEIMWTQDATALDPMYSYEVDYYCNSVYEGMFPLYLSSQGMPETPAQESVNVPVYYVTEDGQQLDFQYASCLTNATTQVYANSSVVPWDYLLVKPASGVVDVFVDSMGNASPSEVRFVYAVPEQPTEAPTEAPTLMPTTVPTEIPTEMPTEAPTQAPVLVTLAPTEVPTVTPTLAPAPQETEEIILPEEETTETPEPAPTEVPTEEPTPEPTATPRPVLTFSADASADPSLIADTVVYQDDSRTAVKEYTRDEKEIIDMPAGDDYTTRKIGVLTYRGTAFRQNAAVGTVEDATQLTQVWAVETGSLKGKSRTYYGFSWANQPVIEQWARRVRHDMPLLDGKNDKTALKEVIAASLDGKIYFLDLEDGSKTREPIELGYPMRSTPSLSTLAYPQMSVGQYARFLANKTGSIGQHFYDLLTNKENLTIDGLDGGSKKDRAYNDVGAFDGSALYDRNSDTYITAGTNGMLYTVHMNTVYETPTDESGNLKVSPTITMMKSRTKKQKDAYTAVEAPIAMYGSYVFYADVEGVLRCVDTTTMTTVWAVETGDAVKSAVALDFDDDGRLWLYTANTLLNRSKGDVTIRRYDATTGAEDWSLALNATKKKDYTAGAMASPVIGQYQLGDLVYYTLSYISASGSEKLLGSGAKAQEGVLVALNKQTGKVVWAKSLGGYCYSSPVAVYNENGKGWIIQATSDGVLMLLDGLTGETINTLQLNGTIEASPAVYQNMLVIGTTGKGTSFLYGVKID